MTYIDKKYRVYSCGKCGFLNCTTSYCSYSCKSCGKYNSAGIKTQGILLFGSNDFSEIEDFFHNFRKKDNGYYQYGNKK